MPAEVVLTSGPKTIKRINQAIPISISGHPSAQYSVGGGPFTNLPGTVTDGSAVRLRMTTARPQGDAVAATLTVGGLSDTWTLTTAADSQPRKFSFADRTGASRGATVTSSTITLGGFNRPLAISVGGSPGARYSLNGGAFTATAGTASAGDTVQLQVVAADAGGTEVTATLRVGPATDTWNVTTAP